MQARDFFILKSEKIKVTRPSWQENGTRSNEVLYPDPILIDSLMPVMEGARRFHEKGGH